jgi:hypothetical protein
VQSLGLLPHSARICQRNQWSDQFHDLRCMCMISRWPLHFLGLLRKREIEGKEKKRVAKELRKNLASRLLH